MLKAMQDWGINDTQDNVRFAVLTENLRSR